jgi:hypothetical protein
MKIDLSLEDEAATLEAMAKVLTDVEEGRGADGIGHGKLRPPAEPLQDGPEPAP